MAQAYETMIIVHPETPEEELHSLIDALKEVIAASQGDCLKVERWGHRKLVYKIKGLLRGYFFLVYYYGNPKILEAIDGLLRYREHVLRYQTVKLDKKIDPESIREADAPDEALEAESASEPEDEKDAAPQEAEPLEEPEGKAAP